MPHRLTSWVAVVGRCAQNPAQPTDLTDLAPKTANLCQFKLSLREWDAAALAALTNLYEKDSARCLRHPVVVKGGTLAPKGKPGSRQAGAATRLFRMPIAMSDLHSIR